ALLADGKNNTKPIPRYDWAPLRPGALCPQSERPVMHKAPAEMATLTAASVPPEFRLINKGPPSSIVQHTRGKYNLNATLAHVGSGSGSATAARTTADPNTAGLPITRHTPMDVRYRIYRARREAQSAVVAVATVARRSTAAVAPRPHNSATGASAQRPGRRRLWLARTPLSILGTGRPASQWHFTAGVRDHSDPSNMWNLSPSQITSCLCGHSHCYRCIRVSLEYRWSCPSCRSTITSPPFRNYDLEAGIAHDFPDWRDLSQVDYSWEGLVFPRFHR
ncbi:hypothetical protein DFH09DRAFT_1117329, partial [Mycena vulgaris]